MGYTREVLEREKRAVGSISQIRFYPAVIEKAGGAYVYDAAGRKLLDFNAAWAVANTGYGHKRVIEAFLREYSKLTALSYTSFSSKTVVSLAERLLGLVADGDGKKVIFGHSGSDANDSIAKILPACTGRPRILSFIGSYHGQTMGSYSISGHKAQSGIVGLPNVVKVPYPYGYRCPFKGVAGQPECEEACIGFLEDYIFNTIAPPETVSVIIVEPLQSDAGDIIPTPRFLRELERIARKHGIYLAVDEVKVGMGRTGRMFAFEHSGIAPDIIVLGKPLASGLPLSAVIMPSELADCNKVMHLFTLSPHPAIAAAALATIDVIEGEDLVGNAERTGKYMLEGLRKLEREKSIVGEVRGLGLIAGIEVVKDKESREPGARETAKIVYRAWELGLVTAYTGLYSNVIELTPPLIIGGREVDEALGILDKAIDDVEKGRVPDSAIKDYVGW
ncbi:MAG: aspartate aminotransferase family protein [Desulfurococcales archaeon]|nr:aspartate aminotransferase family protein [Desulfurococcales archaeon]